MVKKFDDDPDNKNLVTNVDDILTIVDNEIAEQKNRLLLEQARENVKQKLPELIEEEVEKKYHKFLKKELTGFYGKDYVSLDTKAQEERREALIKNEKFKERFDKEREKILQKTTTEFLSQEKTKELIDQEKEELELLSDLLDISVSALKNITPEQVIELDENTKSIIAENAEKQANIDVQNYIEEQIKGTLEALEKKAIQNYKQKN